MRVGRNELTAGLTLPIMILTKFRVRTKGHRRQFGIDVDGLALQDSTYPDSIGLISRSRFKAGIRVHL